MQPVNTPSCGIWILRLFLTYFKKPQAIFFHLADHSQFWCIPAAPYPKCPPYSDEILAAIFKWTDVHVCTNLCSVNMHGFCSPLRMICHSCVTISLFIFNLRFPRHQHMKYISNYLYRSWIMHRYVIDTLRQIYSWIILSYFKIW